MLGGATETHLTKLGAPQRFEKELQPKKIIETSLHAQKCSLLFIF